MTCHIECSVFVVGAGPVGLTLAMDLASRGVDVVIAETRAAGEPPSVKCNHVSARTMEIFRRLGVADTVRAAGLPGDYPHDVSYRTTTTGFELARIIIPSRNGRQAGETGPDTWWPTPEPPHRINQIYLEPILFAHATQNFGIRVLNRIEVISFEQDGAGKVVAIAKDVDTGASFPIQARFMIGCDGGRSFVRKAIGANFIGDAVLQRVQSTYIRASQLIERMSCAPAWSMFSLNPRRCGNIYAIDGREKWLIHNYLLDSEPDFDSVDRDRCIRDIIGVGKDFEYDIISKEDWFGRRLVADKFRDRNVFICGDAAHLWVPYAGYGMNAGIADAANLAWILAAHVQGWAPEGILNAHEAERLPITEQVSRFAMNHAIEMARQRGAVPSDIEASGPEGDKKRAALGKRAYDLNVQQYCCGGLNFGYYYDRSPLIVYDAEKQPGYTMSDFEPSTVPGCRLPHFWLNDGRSVYDALGGGYAMLRLDPSIDLTDLTAAARTRGIPMTVVDVRPSETGDVYRHGLVLARPDQHIAWRGHAVPIELGDLLDTISGTRATN